MRKEEHGEGTRQSREKEEKSRRTETSKERPHREMYVDKVRIQTKERSIDTQPGTNNDKSRDIDPNGHSARQTSQTKQTRQTIQSSQSSQTRRSSKQDGQAKSRQKDTVIKNKRRKRGQKKPHTVAQEPEVPHRNFVWQQFRSRFRTKMERSNPGRFSASRLYPRDYDVPASSLHPLTV